MRTIQKNRLSSTWNKGISLLICNNLYVKKKICIILLCLGYVSLYRIWRINKLHWGGFSKVDFYPKSFLPLTKKMKVTLCSRNKSFSVTMHWTCANSQLVKDFYRYSMVNKLHSVLLAFPHKSIFIKIIETIFCITIKQYQHTIQYIVQIFKYFHWHFLICKL